MARKVRNPKTGYMVKVGGDAWKKMQKRRKRSKSARKRRRTPVRRKRKRAVSRRRKYKRRRTPYMRYPAGNVYRQDAALCSRALLEGRCSAHPQCQWIMATQKCRARMGTRQARGPVYQGPINLPPESRAKIQAATTDALSVVKVEKEKAAASAWHRVAERQAQARKVQLAQEAIGF